jgi:deoxyribodipyrimidine photolyase-related protein
MNFVILPTQLFNKKFLDKEYNYFLWEHPHYFKTYNYNKKKIILHKASLLYYLDYLKGNNFKVKYIPINKKLDLKEYKIYDPVDKIKLPGKYDIIETPNFLLSKEIYKKYIDKYVKKSGRYFFNSFYMFGKKELNLIPNIKSKDKFNRKKLNKNIKIPPLPSNKNDLKYIQKAITFTNKNFKNNYGNTDNFLFPVTHKTANNWLDNFIDKKFKLFGDYQDAITTENDFLFHSVLSSSINIGLINPSEIVEKILKIKNKVPINSFEGYIRQLFWREYMRITYNNLKFNKNYFNNNKKLDKSWYSGETGILPIDDCIKKAFETGYLHHIERLMIIGNYMNIIGIKPIDGYKWFMEFSCDSYDWVMATNVYEMVFFCSGGQVTRKPYVSSSNYVLKMSDYKKGEWSNIWDENYQKFMKKNKTKLWKYRYHFPGLKKI